LLPNDCKATIKRERPSDFALSQRYTFALSQRYRLNKPYGGKNPPDNLIEIPSLGGRGSCQPSLTVNDVWMVWNATLRNLDHWHMALISDRNGISPRNLHKTWAGKWYIKYRYYREIGVEIDERLAKNDGLSEDDLVDRLETVRQNIKHNRSIQALVDGLRLERGSKPFNSKRKTGFDISGELKKQFDEVCPTYLWKA
jgi:hypothetical protein